jgi:asparagine synthase (glutamine-hydrolysing)
VNVFVLAWAAAPDTKAAIVDALGEKASLYPHVDAETLWSFEAGAAFAASVHTARKIAHPREYVCRTDDDATLYSGIFTTNHRGLGLHRAQHLADHWDQLPELLEGQFAAARVRRDPPTIELLLDPLGVEQIYFVRSGPSWVISNCAGLLERVVGTVTLDELGASLFLSIGWVAGDRTLRREIRVFRGGQHVRWSTSTRDPVHEIYFARSDLPRLRRNRGFTRADGRALGAQLTALLGSLAQDFGVLDCPLTSGRDSRLLAALVLSTGAPSRFFTGGESGSTDVEVARSIAEELGLEHELSLSRPADVITEWSRASEQLVRETDGLVSLVQTGDIIGRPQQLDALTVKLHGFGAEIARSFFIVYSGGPAKYFDMFTARRMLERFPDEVARSHLGLVTCEAQALARSYVQEFLQDALDEGFDVLDLPDVFYAYERVRRWGGSNFRKWAPVRDFYSPFCTRPFIEAAYTLAPRYRYVEAIHYQITRELNARLHSLAFGKAPWPAQRPTVAFGRAGLDALRRRRSRRREDVRPRTHYDKEAWLEGTRDQIRDLCLSQPGSPLWSIADRQVFERLMAPATDPAERAALSRPLLAVATMFQYDVVARSDHG